MERSDEAEEAIRIKAMPEESRGTQNKTQRLLKALILMLYVLAYIRGPADEMSLTPGKKKLLAERGVSTTCAAKGCTDPAKAFCG